MRNDFTGRNCRSRVLPLLPIAAPVSFNSGLLKSLCAGRRAMLCEFVVQACGMPFESLSGDRH